MIIDRYERPASLPGSRLSDPILQELDWILEDPELFRLVRSDLAKHYKRSRVGRPPVPVEVSLRMMVLRRRKQWSLRQTEQEVRDGAGYRDWVRVYDHDVPDHTTLNDLERLVQGKTQHQINDRLLALAESKHLTQGYKLRLDSSVTETNIRYPTDSGLLLDGVRLLSCWLEGATPLLSRKLMDDGVGRNRVRSARRRARLIGQLSHSTPKQEHHRQAKKKEVAHLYGELIEITRLSLDQATQAAESLGQQKDNPAAQALVSQLGQVRPLVERVIDQATRRVLQGESVPAQQKVASLWEPHTQIIRRGKPQPHETEFGHKVNYADTCTARKCR
jgi:IS5 family transposase